MLIKRSHFRSYRKGFTLAECVLSLMVVGIVLAAAATLAFAMHSADRVTDNMGESQAYVRYATMRISELIGKSNMVFSTSYLRRGICVWTDNDGDEQIDPLELVYVEYDSADDEIDMVSFSSKILRVHNKRLSIIKTGMRKTVHLHTNTDILSK